MVILVSPNYPLTTMSKSSNFFGQPIYGQLIKSLNRDKIVEILAETDGDIQAAIEIIRKKGRGCAQRNAKTVTPPRAVCSQAHAATSPLSLPSNAKTDFVAKNDSFRALAKKILELALNAKVKSLDELKGLDFDGTHSG